MLQLTLRFFSAAVPSTCRLPTTTITESSATALMSSALKDDVTGARPNYPLVSDEETCWRGNMLWWKQAVVETG